MLVSIENVTITESNDIIITAANLERMLLADDLFAPMMEDGDEEVTFHFDPSLRSRKYLYKICQSQRQAKDKKCLGEMIEALQGCIVSLSEGFLER